MRANQVVARLVDDGAIPTHRHGSYVVDRQGTRFLVVSVDPANDTAVVADDNGRKHNMSFWYLNKMCRHAE
jgi:hypothetical protein